MRLLKARFVHDWQTNSGPGTPARQRSARRDGCQPARVLSGLSEEHLAEYEPSWPDEQVLDWDGNFRSDGQLMLVCCERDVDVQEFRRVLELHLRFWQPTRRA